MLKETVFVVSIITAPPVIAPLEVPPAPPKVPTATASALETVSPPRSRMPLLKVTAPVPSTLALPMIRVPALMVVGPL